MKELLKKRWKEVTIVVLLLLFGLTIFFGWQHITNLERQANLLAHHADSAWLAVDYYKGKDGKQTAQINVQQLTIGDLTRLGERLGTDNHALKQQIGKLSNLIVYYKGQAEFKGTAVVKAKDTTVVDPVTNKLAPVFTGAWTNNYLYLNTTFFPETSKFIHEYSYDLGGFELTAYRKPTGFLGLGKGKPLADLKFGDPNMQVTRFEGYHVIEGPTPVLRTRGFVFGLGVVVGILFMSKL